MRNQRMSLRGKRILLTGASSGIGRELAVALAAQGAVLMLAARREDLLDVLADEIARGGYPRPLVCAVDLSVPGAARSLGQRAVELLEPLTC